MTKTFTILIVLLFATGLIAQENHKDWREGKLTLNDFSKRENSQSVSELIYFLGYNTVKHKYGDTTVFRIEAKCYMDKNLSWVNPEYMTEQILRYNQVIFDIVEIYRRRLQFELDRGGSLYEIGDKFNAISAACNNTINDFSTDSNGGQDLNSIAFWEQKNSTELQSLPVSAIPEFETRSLGYAIHAGLGGGFFTGSLGEHFTPTFNFMYGFDLAYKRSILHFNGTLAGDNVRKDYISDKSWNDGQRTSIAMLDASYGYVLIENKKIKLSPFVGFGITEFSEAHKDEDERLSMVDNHMVFGVNTDFKINTKIQLTPTPFLGVREKVVTSIRARLYVARPNYYEDLQGYSVNLTIGLCGFGNIIKLK